MSQKKCKYCGDYYEYSVESNGYSETYCTFSCEMYARVNELKSEVEKNSNSLQQLKAEIRSVVDDFVCVPPVRIAQEIDSFIYKLRELSAV